MSGALSSRPSARTTRRVCSSVLTSTALASSSTIEVCIPTLQKQISIFFHQVQYDVKFVVPEAMICRISDGIEPELCHIVISLDVDMRGLVTFIAEE